VMAVFGKWNWYNPIKRLRRVKENKDTQAPNATEAQIEQKPQ
jgi:hypothetical protein